MHFLGGGINGHHFLIVSCMTRDILAIPLSTVASESACSAGGRHLDPFRSSLTPKVTHLIFFLSKATYFFHFIYALNFNVLDFDFMFMKDGTSYYLYIRLASNKENVGSRYGGKFTRVGGT